MSKTAKTFTATVWVGTRVHYSGEILPISLAEKFLQEFVKCGLCVTLTPTEYIYTDGGEPGFAVGLINYPRFPADEKVIRTRALDIAQGLLKLYQQFKVTVVFPDVTVMVEADQ